MKIGVKKKARKEIKMQITLVLLTIIFIVLIYYFISPVFIGSTVLEGYIWNTENSSNFNFNNEEIEIADGVIKLKANISSANWTTYSQEILPIVKAYYDPSDKTSKITEQDNNRQEIASDKITSLIFDSDLNNGNIINIYLKDEETTNVYLCNAYEECTSSNLGSVYFPDQTGYYNLTIQNLNNSKRIFNLNSDEEIEIDFINSTNANVTKFWYDPSDKTTKINAQDNTTLKADNDKIFDIIFSQKLQNDDIIQLYLKNEKTTNTYLCTAGEECTSANLGSVFESWIAYRHEV